MDQPASGWLTQQEHLILIVFQSTVTVSVLNFTALVCVVRYLIHSSSTNPICEWPISHFSRYAQTFPPNPNSFELYQKWTLWSLCSAVEMGWKGLGSKRSRSPEEVTAGRNLGSHPGERRPRSSCSDPSWDSIVHFQLVHPQRNLRYC